MRMRDPRLGLNQRNRLEVGSRFARLEAVSIAQYQGRIQGSVDRSSGGFSIPREFSTVSHSMTSEFARESARVFLSDSGLLRMVCGKQGSTGRAVRRADE